MLTQLSHFVSVIPAPSDMTVATLGACAEILMRYVPSQKPLSIIHAASEGFHVLGDGLEKIAKILDRIFGQNQTTPQA